MKSEIVPIAGDASFRKFYRISLNRRNKIIVYARKKKYQNLIAYTAINSFLRKNKILAPKLYSHNFSKGIIVIEDFGDLSFHKALLQQKDKIKNYKKLVDLLIKVQKITPPSKINNLIGPPHLIKKYSYKELHKESDLFFKWYLQLLCRPNKVAIMKKSIKKILSKHYKNLNFKNSFFVHRDYHVQNLMKIGKKIGIIDSQDAMIGNPAYDLVSLIDDVRINTSKVLKKKILQHYLKKNIFIIKKKSHLFLEDFNILSIQRSLKIIGIFSRLFKRDKKIKYLKLIPYSWKLLEMRLDSKIFKDLKKILDKNINKNLRKQVLYK